MTTEVIFIILIGDLNEGQAITIATEALKVCFDAVLGVRKAAYDAVEIWQGRRAAACTRVQMLHMH